MFLEYANTILESEEQDADDKVLEIYLSKPLPLSKHSVLWKSVH